MGRRREDIVSLFVASAVCARSAVACAACALLFELTTIVNFFCGESSAEPLRSYLILSWGLYTSFSNTTRINECKPTPSSRMVTPRCATASSRPARWPCLNRPRQLA